MGWNLMLIGYTPQEVELEWQEKELTELQFKVMHSGKCFSSLMQVILLNIMKFIN